MGPASRAFIAGAMVHCEVCGLDLNAAPPAQSNAYGSDRDRLWPEVLAS